MLNSGSPPPPPEEEDQTKHQPSEPVSPPPPATSSSCLHASSTLQCVDLNDSTLSSLHGTRQSLNPVAPLLPPPPPLRTSISLPVFVVPDMTTLSACPPGDERHLGHGEDGQSDYIAQPASTFGEEHHVNHVDISQPDSMLVGNLPLPEPLPSEPLPDLLSPALIPLPDESMEPVTSLAEICRLLRLQKYQTRRCRQIQGNLRSLHIAAARTSRLVSAARSIRQTLAECLRAEDKSSFVNLVEACYDAFDDCLAPLPVAPEWNPDSKPRYPGVAPSFLEDVSPPARATVVDLLTKLRYDGSFIADRLAALTHKELVSLLPARASSGSNESVFGGSIRQSSRSAKPLGFVVDAKVDLITSQGFGSPLETLVSAVRSVSGDGTLEEDRATDVWATVCSRLISAQKPGSEKLVPALLDIWASLFPWPEKDGLEIWMMRTIQEGSFLLDQPSKYTFRARAQGRSDINLEEELRVETFYSRTIESLFDLLGDRSGPSIIPPGALRLCRAISEKLQESPGHLRAFPQFIITRWLFSTFIPDALSLPEANGFLNDVYIGDSARQHILRETVARSQKIVFDVAYSWKHGNYVAPNMFQRVQTIMETLQDPQSRHSSPNTPTPSTYARTLQSKQFLVLSINDLAVLLSSLYPQRRPPSVSSDRDNFRSGLHSSASSVSGFSLFPKLGAPDVLSDSHNASPQPVTEKPSFEKAPLGANGVDEPVHQSVPPTQQTYRQLNEDQIREVRLELEDLAATRRPSCTQHWAVLVVDPVSKIPRTLLDDYNLVVPENWTQEGELDADLATHEYAPFSRTLEMLLNEVIDSKLPSNISESALERESVGQVELQVVEIFKQIIQEYQIRTDFVEAHLWHRRLQDYQNLRSRALDFSELQIIVNTVEQKTRHRLIQTGILADAGEKWLRSLRPRSELQERELRPLLQEFENLRNKMWYVADVRTSAAYDEARTIIAALRIMGKAKRSQQTRSAPPLRHWSGSRISYTSLHLKSEAQILELLSAKPDHGGPNKLSDGQSRTTSLWMEHQNVHNLCKGEERLHKFCMEIRKCVDQLVALPSANTPTVWSNVLFARDRALAPHLSPPKNPTLTTGLYHFGNRADLFAFQPNTRNTESTPSECHTLSNASSRDQLSSYSPTLTHKSSIQFWSPAMTEVDSPSSATSVGSSQTRPAYEPASRKHDGSATIPDEDSLDLLRQHLTSLVLSDLTTNLFSEGSETDIAFWTGLGHDLADSCFRIRYPALGSAGNDSTRVSDLSHVSFDFDAAFSRLLQKFSASPNPFKKLGILYDIDRLLAPYVAEQRERNTHVVSPDQTLSSFEKTASRQQSQQLDLDANIDGFQRLFTQSSTRPSTIFRDLQYIAALIPSSILEYTPQGKAFFNAVFAISHLKREARNIMVETADSIIAYHSNNRGHGQQASSVAQQRRDSATFSSSTTTSYRTSPPSHEATTNNTNTTQDVIARYSMADAAYLLQITAKEGDPVAQRELATLYLTHPELMDHIIAPFAKPRDVFKEELEGKWRKNRDPNRCDPTTMCVAHHWMILSSKGGDALATEYLRQREEMDRLP